MSDAHWLYMYHVYDGKIVQEYGESTDQVEAAYRGDPRFKRQWVAASHSPIDVKELEGNPKARGATAAKPIERPALPPYVAPAQTPPPVPSRVKRMRAKGEAAKRDKVAEKST